jgi:hypothetical protein
MMADYKEWQAAQKYEAGDQWREKGYLFSRDQKDGRNSGGYA